MKLPYYANMLLGKLPEGAPFGVVAEFDTPAQLLAAARGVRDAGYKAFDVHSPFPIHGMDGAMGIRRSLLPFLVLGGGLAGCLGGLALQWYTSAWDYPLVISGKPYFSVPAFIPVTFELTILLAGLTTVGGMFLLNFLPMLYHPLFRHERFRRATDDKFFLSIEARDKRFDPQATRELLEGLGGQHIALLEP